uniref:Uncharacterized protein n=1 Tax=Hordeum vulgare subsp. vulgare TaxID=112509 RepID=A0A8I6Y8M1_HORVV
MAAPSPPTPGTGRLPTMADIMAASRAQGLRMRLSTFGPLFRVTATRVGGDGDVELGRAEGAVRPWPGGAVLHLDSMRMSRATLEVPNRPLFGLGIFLGAVTVRHGFDAGCVRAELLAINDTPLYHKKLVKFYTRMGFKAVHEVHGSSITDFTHMLVWGGRGTRMDADIEQLLASSLNGAEDSDLKTEVSFFSRMGVAFVGGSFIYDSTRLSSGLPH